MRIVVLLLLCAPFLVNAKQQYYYSMNFEGLLSAWQPVSIADVMLTVGDSDLDTRRVRLDVSSQHHGFLEALYPLRFCAESVYFPEQNKTLNYHNIQQGAEQKQVDLRYDWQAKTVVYEQQELVQNISQNDNFFGFSDQPDREKMIETKKETVALPETALDRLSAIVQVSHADFVTQKSFTLLVIVKGETRKNKAELVAEEPVLIDGEAVMSYKLKISEFKLNEDAPSDVPVYVWVDQTGENGIVKAVLDHALGSFVMYRTSKTQITSICANHQGETL